MDTGRIYDDIERVRGSETCGRIRQKQVRYDCDTISEERF